MARTITLVTADPGVPYKQVKDFVVILTAQMGDFAGAWPDVEPATVTVAPDLQDVAPDAWPIVMTASDHYGDALGIHDDDGNPMAMVQPSLDWRRGASHEMLEMLVDSDLAQFEDAASPLPGQGTVGFLKEICDPVGTAVYQRGIHWVSDFCLPGYYDPSTGSGDSTSFNGTLTGPFTLASGGYISWHCGNDWWQQKYGEIPVELGPLLPASDTNPSIRSILYGLKAGTRHTAMTRRLILGQPPLIPPTLRQAHARHHHAQVAARHARAESAHHGHHAAQLAAWRAIINAYA